MHMKTSWLSELFGGRSRRLKRFLAAAEHGDVMTVQKLLAQDSSLLHTRNKEGFCSLDVATGEGKKEVIEFLLSKGADVNAKSYLGNTPLHWAMTNKDVEIARLILSAGGDVNAFADKGVTPLHLAATVGAIEGASLLLENGANVNAQSEGGGTPLHMAVLAGKEAMVKLLLAKGADVNAPSNSGTPMRLAQLALQRESMPNCRELIELLRSHGGRE
jgi:ankyrin repeat protein